MVGPLGKKRTRERGNGIAANCTYNPNVSKLDVHPRKFVFYDQSNIKVFLNTEKVCNYADLTWVGFVQMHEHCYLVTRDVFYVTFHWESS